MRYSQPVACVVLMAVTASACLAQTMAPLGESEPAQTQPAQPAVPTVTVSGPSAVGVSAPLWVLANAPAPTPPTSQPAVPTEQDRKTVADIIRTIDPAKPESAANARQQLINKSPAIYPAMKESLACGNFPGTTRGLAASDALKAAIAATEWKVQAADKVRQWCAKETKQENIQVNPAPFSDEALTRNFPDYVFYVVRFPMYPVTMAPPEPLQSANFFAVAKDDKTNHKDGKVLPLMDQTVLKEFFIANFPAVKEEANAKDAVQAWLTLSTEFANDGMMHFTISPDQIKAAKKGDHWEATGAATLDDGLAAGQKRPPGRIKFRGDQGGITVTITFDDKGKFKDAVQAEDIERGIRPL